MTVEAVGTLQTQRQIEESFFTVTLNDSGVQRDRRIPRSKIRRIMNEFAEQLFEKGIRTLYIIRE